MQPVPYHRPTNIEAALALKTELTGARFIAGGTDLLLRMKDGVCKPDALISLRSVIELTGVRMGDGVLIGAMTLLSDLLDNEALMADWPMLGECLRTFASVQIRNAATVGGNLCNASPAADLAPPLMVLGARASIVGPRGGRSVPIEEFFSGPGRSVLADDELLAAVHFDARRPGERSTVLKRMRTAMDVALASVAASVRIEGERVAEIRLAAGSVGPVPMRLREAEAALRGLVPTEERIAEARRLAEAEVRPISDLRSGADYRRQIVGVYVQRALRTLCQENP